MENQLVTLLKITSPPLGSFVKDKLESEGIECFFTNEGLSLENKYNPNEVFLNVKVKQAEKAVLILLQIHKEYDLKKIEKDTSYRAPKKILVPVKLSEGCINLCQYAIALAKKTNAELKLLYVYEDPSINQTDRHTASWERYVKLELQEANRKAKQKLVRFSLDLKKSVPHDLIDSINLHYRMLKGTPINVITEASERYQPDLILMGTCGNSENGEFLKNTTLKVIENSNFPVMIVPESPMFKGKKNINVMYGTSFYDSDNSSLNKLLNILSPYDKTIFCVHIEDHKDVHHEEMVKELNKKLDEEYPDINISCELFKSDNLVQGYNDFVEKNKIDLISVSKIKRSALYKMFHSNQLKQLISTEKIPMLIFPV